MISADELFGNFKTEFEKLSESKQQEYVNNFICEPVNHKRSSNKLQAESRGKKVIS